MGVNDIQHGGDHYKSVVGYQHWDIMADYRVPYLEANGSKYGYRWPKKNGEEDILKFRHYIEKVMDKHLNEQYQPMSLLPAEVWNDFCKANNVDEVSAEATLLLLTWRNYADLQRSWDLAGLLLERARAL